MASHWQMKYLLESSETLVLNGTTLIIPFVFAKFMTIVYVPRATCNSVTSNKSQDTHGRNEASGYCVESYYKLTFNFFFMLFPYLHNVKNSI